MGKSDKILTSCLYFSANSFSRSIAKLADDEFKKTGLSPAHAFLLMLVNENLEILPKELSNKLKISPSTVTRFLDQLEQKDLIIRKSNKRSVIISPTLKGKQLEEPIETAWKNLYKKYTNILGEKYSSVLTALINDANGKLYL